MSIPSAPATTIDTLTLGRSVRLGELYNAHASQFLGVQLYDGTKISQASSSEKSQYSQLNLSMANSFEDKASTIDIKAELSVDVLGGLVKVEGSAAYLNDTKSNTREKAWAMSLTTRISERRLAFAEPNLGSNILEWVKKEYINKGTATHFVSSIVYGGKVIVNMVARESKLSKEEKVEGALQVQLEKLQGAVDLKAKADLKIKGKFDGMNDKFDIIMHGDIDLKTVPVNPVDVLDLFHEARTLIGDGVPISVTLQPIPEDLLDKQTLIYRLDQTRLHNILRAFGTLADIRSRFDVLLKAAKVSNSIPELATSVTNASAVFIEAQGALLNKLSYFVRKYHLDGSPSDDGTAFIREANELAKKHLQQADDYQAPKYPTNLLGLEQAYDDFQAFVTVVEDIGVHWNTLPEVKKAATNQPIIALFIMSPLNSSGGATSLAYFSSLAHKGHSAYASQNPPIPVYFLYVETLAILSKNLPNGGHFASLTGPSLFLGIKVDDGSTSWDPVRLEELKAQVPIKVYDFTFGLVVDDSKKYCYQTLEMLDTSRSFTIMAKAKYDDSPKTPAPARELLLILDDTGITDLRIELRDSAIDLLIAGPGTGSTSMAQGNNKHLGTKDVTFSVVFIQDVTTSKWILYVNETKINERPIIENLIQGKVQLYGGLENDWRGNLYSFRAYSKALSAAEVQQALRQ